MSDFKQIRACQVLHGVVGGGSEQVVLNYCSRMRNIHFDLLYQYEPNSQILERFNEAGINCIQIPDKVHHPLMHLWTMFNIFRKGHYDVVHCHLDWYMNSYVCFIAMLAGIKKRIAHHHQAYSIKQVEGMRKRWVSLPNHLAKNLLCALFRVPCKMFATHWLACGEAAAVNGWGNSAVKKGKVIILPNAVDPERFKFNESARKEIRTRYGIKGGDFVVGHVGRFYPQKNHEFLIDAFYEAHKQKPNAKLLLLGDGPLQEKIRQKVEALGLTASVIFAGLQKDPAPFYSAMDVFAFPSLWEGVPLTLVEAQYNGLPCIVSDAVSQEIAITENVFSLPTNNVSIWCEKIGLTRCVLNRKIPQIKINQYDIRTNYKMMEKIYGF